MERNEISASQIETELLIIIKQFLAEINPRQTFQRISKHTYLDRDLGIDSLGRVELFRRIQKHFKIRFPDAVIAQAESIQDLITAIQKQEITIPIQHDHVHAIMLEASVIPKEAKTLIDVLLHYQNYDKDRPHIYLQNESGDEQIITYGHLYQQATSIASGLLALGLKHHDTVAIMLPTSPAFFYIFIGVLLAGGIPVPIYPPFRPDRIAEYAIRESTILRNAEIRILITFHRAEMLSRLLQVFIPSLKSVVTEDDLKISSHHHMKFKIDATDPALIQYTSGSTSAPKGVLLTHANLLANIRAYGKEINIQFNDVVMSWLPLYHDMGLIGTWLGSFYHGMPVVIMSPLSFLSRPARWLWSIHYHRATLSGGPNFAYELCINKIDEDEIEGLDLSSWRVAFNGAEAVNPHTLERFYQRFKKYGFKQEALFPVFGLAESSVALTVPQPGTIPRIDRIERHAFEKELKAIPTQPGEENIIEFVSCGKPITGHRIRIVDDDDHELPERHIGNAQFQGPSAMQGYFHNVEATKTIYHDGWWSTDDLGYMADGDFFITGRKKDIIIKAGRNFYPEEIEEATAEVTGVRKGCVAAFGVSDPQSGTEKIIIVAETRAEGKQQLQIEKEIIEKVTTTLSVPPDHVILVPPRTIPKTSSGKLRRSSCKQDYLNHKIGKAQKPAWLQITLLYLHGAAKAVISSFNFLGRVVYTAYVVFVCALLILPLWLSIAIAPKAIAKKFARWFMRLAFFLCGFRVIVKNKEILKNLPQPVVFVANHASYIDAGVLAAILPPAIMVAKQELKNAPILKHWIKKLDHVYVERFDFSKSVADTELIIHKLRAGYSILIFPEGTFYAASGVRPFRLGAFKMAVETGAAIVPIALRGTRKILRSDSKWFRPGTITITIEPLLYPQENNWQEMLRLRNLSRQTIAKDSGEDIINI